MAEPDGTPRFVEGRDRVETIPQTRDHGLGVTLVCIGGRACRPAAVAHQRQRQVPVIEGRKGLDAARLQSVDKAVVKVEPLLVDRPVPSGTIRGQAIEKR